MSETTDTAIREAAPALPGDVDEMLRAPSADFDYQTLGTLATAVQASADRIKVLARRSVEDAIEIGRELVTIRGLLKGRFLAWVRSEFGWSQATAYRLIWIAERFADCSQLDNFTLPALNLLAAPGVPHEVAQTAISIAEQGDLVDSDIAHELLEDETLPPADDVGPPPAGDAPDEPSSPPETRDEVDAALEQPWVDPGTEDADAEATEEPEAPEPEQDHRLRQLQQALSKRNQELSDLTAVCRQAIEENSVEPLRRHLRYVADGP